MQPPHICVTSPIINFTHQNGIFFFNQEWIYVNTSELPKSIVYSCCIFSGSQQVYNNICPSVQCHTEHVHYLKTSLYTPYSPLPSTHKFYFFYYFIFKLYIIVLVLPNSKMNPPQVYMCSPSWTLLPPPSPYHPSGSSQCTSPKHPVLCIEPGLATRIKSHRVNLKSV